MLIIYIKRVIFCFVYNADYFAQISEGKRGCALYMGTTNLYLYKCF